MNAPVDYAALTEKTCSACGETKPVAEFGRYNDPRAALSTWRYLSRCKLCSRRASKVYGETDRGRRNRRLQKWREANPESKAALDRRKHLARYGLTPESYAAMETEQGGKCKLCGAETALVIDHCHDTGRVRGLLCTHCNVSLGWLEKTPGMLARAAVYLHQDGKPLLEDCPWCDRCHVDTLGKIANGVLP